MNKASKLSDPVVRVLAINNAAALREGGRHRKDMSSNLKKIQGPWKEAESKLLPMQRVLLTLNKALMLMHSGKIDEAKQILAAVKEKGGKEGGQAWWRVAMLEIAIKMQDENASTSTYSPNADLEALLQRVRTEASPFSSTADAEKTVGTALAQVLVYQVGGGGGGAAALQEQEQHQQQPKKKNPEAIKRRRARARAAYLAELTAAGKYDATRPGPPPDPERWIAKSQRSYNKRGKKGRARFVGAQGSGDGAQKDTARLDVASRVAAEKKKGGGEEEKGGPMGGVKMAGGRRRKK
eukprot:evm.model.NODE_14167_length_11795_cov_55.725307.5